MDIPTAIRSIQESRGMGGKCWNSLIFLSKYTGITDLEWLFEVFKYKVAVSAEEAIQLFQQELAENAEPFR
jgi:hypothetical protein